MLNAVFKEFIVNRKLLFTFVLPNKINYGNCNQINTCFKG